MREVYLDNAAATAVDPRVIRAVAAASREAGNPSAFNDAGRRARRLLEDARAGVARFLNARSGEVVFCASGSEANALALLGAAGSQRTYAHAIGTRVEHPSVLAALERLEGMGWTVTRVPVDDAGRVSAGAIADAIRRDTVLISVMYANNEVGAIQPVKAVAKAVREWRRRHRSRYPLLHVDACQAAAWLPLDVQDLGVDLLTFNGAKIHGPRGTAALYVRSGITLRSQVAGGGQEQGIRAGTEDVPGAVGLARACALVAPADRARVAALRDVAIAGILRLLPDARLNGPAGDGRIANNVHVSIPGVSGEDLLLELDARGIRAGSGAACTAHRVETSHVLRAMGVPRRFLSGALRVTLSRTTTRHDIARLLGALPEAVAAARRRHA